MARGFSWHPHENTVPEGKNGPKAPFPPRTPNGVVATQFSCQEGDSAPASFRITTPRLKNILVRKPSPKQLRTTYAKPSNYPKPQPPWSPQSGNPMRDMKMAWETSSSLSVPRTLRLEMMRGDYEAKSPTPRPRLPSQKPPRKGTPGGHEDGTDCLPNTCTCLWTDEWLNEAPQMQNAISFQAEACLALWRR